MIATNMFRPVLTNDDLFWAQLFPDMHFLDLCNLAVGLLVITAVPDAPRSARYYIANALPERR